MTRRDPPWYADGLRFECQECGACCVTHGDCEYVFLADADVAAIADHLGREQVEFLDEYCISEAGSTWLKMPSAACVFLVDRARCRIYPVRPRQCSTWPFWTENLASGRAWEATVAALCPGVGQGPLFPAREIERRARERDTWLRIDFHG